jgi:hypothetical protein
MSTMSALSHNHRGAAAEIRLIGERAFARGGPADRIRLLPSGDGWSLVGPDGSLLFYGLGHQGRRKCLEWARARGVLAVFS